MPVLINEVIAEVNSEVTPQHQSQPLQTRSPVSQTEYELLKMLALMEERKVRLTID